MKKLVIIALTFSFTIITYSYPVAFADNFQINQECNNGKTTIYTSYNGEQLPNVSVFLYRNVAMNYYEGKIVTDETGKAELEISDKINYAKFSKGGYNDTTLKLEQCDTQSQTPINPSSSFLDAESISEKNQKIPNWIRSNAGWWAMDEIEESDFLNGIKYLIEQNIIVIPESGISEISIQSNYKSYDLPKFGERQEIHLEGIFPNYNPIKPLHAKVITPVGEETGFYSQPVGNLEGFVEGVYELNYFSEAGEYKIIATSENKIVHINSFFVVSKDNSIPAWIKNNALWWSEGKITDNDFLEGIKFLIQNNILDSTFISKNNNEKTISTKSFSQNCLGDARCFTGTVTQVTDGDTIQIDGKSIRFALASASELYQFEGEDSREFIDTICPVGSKALVDEDDGQTEGSYGRIIGVVYCNGMNLNSELLDANLGYLISDLCSKSEFSSNYWAQKHGCTKITEYTTSSESRVNNCDPSYPDVCIPFSLPDLDCDDISYREFTVLPPDPHKFDRDNNGIGCEN